jgi:two-component system, response regulator
MTGPSTRPQSLLLVEDNVDDYEATVRALKKANMSNPVIWSPSGEDALARLRRRDGEHTWPGLILLDLNMPGLDGRQTLQLIKEDPALRRIPVIILTTSGDERDIENCYQLGANTYIQKPVSFEGLIEALRRLNEYWFEIALLPRDAAQDPAILQDSEPFQQKSPTGSIEIL